MRKKYLPVAAGILLCLSAACNVMPEPPVSPQYFDFGPVSRLAAAAASPPNLHFGGVTAASWMNKNAIQYRQLYRQPNALREYTAHSWVAPPAELLARRVNYLLFRGQGSQDGDKRHGPVARLYLRLVLDTFEQVYESPASARVRIRILATVVDARDNPVARREFSGHREAAPDVQGAVDSLPVLADKLIMELFTWLSALQPNRQVANEHHEKQDI